MKYSFTWNGTSCRTKGIRLFSMPDIIRPEERVNHVVIPGRSGELTLVEGVDIYNSYIQSIPLAVDNAADVAAAEKWLRGEGFVTFGGQSTLKQRARIINAVTFTKHSKNSAWWDGEVQFYCDPLKQLITEESVEVTSSGTTVNNPGDVVSRPRIKITGSGLITLTAGGKTLTLTGVESGWYVDSDLQWVTDGNGTPLQGVYTGDFPVFNPGNNTMQFTGSVSKLTIEGRWRFL